MLRTLLIVLLLAWQGADAKAVTLTTKQANEIARKVWINEGAGLRKYLVHWNKGEEFASLGIGHFIWFTKDQPMWFWEAFPAMLRYITARGAKPPKWLTPDTHCIWNSYGEWQKAKRTKSKRHQELEAFLDRTKGLQARFMLHRLNQGMPKIYTYIKDAKQRKRVTYNFNRLMYRPNGSISPQGAYILIDYINFKGDGATESERYQGKGWGLLQVLDHMDPRDSNAPRAFAKSARFILDRLTKICPPERNLKRFKKGWFRRTDTYYSRGK